MAINLIKGLKSATQQEKSEWKEFKRENVWHARVLIALINARRYHACGSRAYHAYESMILQLFSVHVSDAARERYKQGFTEEQIAAGHESDDADTAIIVSCEAGMLKALEEISPWNGGHIEEMLDDYFGSLYLRWRCVRRIGLGGVEERSGNGANLAPGAKDSPQFLVASGWTFIPLPEVGDCEQDAGDALGGDEIEGRSP